MMKGQKGITLVALVITIIVMLILVGVTINLALDSGLLSKANEAAAGTNNAAAGETDLVNNNMVQGNDIFKKWEV